MDQQKYNWLAQQRATPGAMDYEDAQAFDAAQSRGEFNQFAGQAQAAPPSDERAVPTPDLTPTPTTTTTLPDPNAEAGTQLQSAGPNQMIPTQQNIYQPSQFHNFANDLNLTPAAPGTKYPDTEFGARLLQTFNPEVRGIGPVARSTLMTPLRLPGALAAQAGDTPGAQDVGKYAGDAATALYLAKKLLNNPVTRGLETGIRILRHGR